MFDFYTEVPLGRTLSGLIKARRQQSITSLISFYSSLGKLFNSLLLALFSTAFLTGQAIGQTNVYLATAAIGAGDGSNWNNARAGDAYFASAAFKGATLTDTHIYIKKGTYSVNNNVNTYLGTNSTMQGGFPSSATGIDKTGYNPTTNATTINVTGPNFLSGTANPSSTVELKGIRFIGGGSIASGPLFYGPGSGGGGTPGIFKATDLYVSNFVVGGNAITLGSSGGATQSIFTNCVFTGNSAGLGGGAIWVGSLNTPITITGCSFTNNTARFNNSTGGGAVASFSDATIANSYFCNNTAETGGALSNASSSAPPVIWTITGCTFYSNSATALYGGALFAYAGAVHINNTNFYNNTASVGGGAIYRGTNYFTDQTNNITNCIFYSNSVVGSPGTGSADGYGGGAIHINQPNADIPIYNCKFVNNSTVSNQRPGGAIYLYNFNTAGSKKVILDQNTLFYGNTFGGSSTNLGADFIASNTGFSGITTFTVSNTKVQLSAAASPPYQTFNMNFGNLPWPYDFSGGGNTPNNTDNGGVTAFAGSCPSNISPICLAADDPAPAFATTTFANLCPANTVTLPSTATNQNADVTLTWHSATPATNANKLPSNVVSTPGTYYAAFYDASSDCYSPTTTPVTVTINSCPVPDLTPIIYARPGTVYNTTPITVVVDVLELRGVATSGLITVKLTKDPLVSLSFPASSGSVGGRSVQNGSWSYDGVSDPGYYIFTTSQSIVGGDQLSFGMEGTLSPGATGGSVTISVTIAGGSGGEVKVSNNADADKIDYFQQ